MIIVHIGMHKAGSTALQSLLAQHAERLKALGVLYPVTGRGLRRAHHDLSRSLLSGSPSSAEGLWNLLREELGPKPGHAIISSEGFENVKPELLASALSGLDVKIICYTRPPVYRIPSAYSQDTKFGFNVDDFDTYFDHIRPFTRAKWQYADLFMNWAQAFGISNFRARCLHSLVGRRGLLEDCLGLVNISLAELAGKDAQLLDENNSPSWQTVEMLRVIHKGARVDLSAKQKRDSARIWKESRLLYETAELIGTRLGWSDRGKYLNSQQIDRLTASYDDQLIRISEIGVDSIMSSAIGSVEPREFMPEPSCISPQQQATFLAEVASKMLRRSVGYPED
jgi:hypothetical protein